MWLVDWSTLTAMNKLPLQFDAVVAAPFGAVGIFAFNEQVSIELLTEAVPIASTPKPAENKTVQKIASQIEAYFGDAKHDFHLPITQHGTVYQQRVWQAISAIPRGRVLTYGDIAAQIGSGARAVANACGANNLPLIVPCHRVVAKGGLGGFMQGNKDGLKIKKWLLKHEGVSI
jgi:methylated-DNA-[protein]-cysteine S-methyltransferase